MQTRHESILRAVNNISQKYNILTFPTHERAQSAWRDLPHTFYLFQGQGIKTWNNKYAQLPKNHILLDGGPAQIKLDMKFDFVISQNKMAHFELSRQLANQFHIPLISIEHTLPPPNWNHKYLTAMKEMRGDINVFISDYSVEKWGWDKNDPTVRVVQHGIDTQLFIPAASLDRDDIGHDDGKILTVANLYQERNWALGWDLYRRVTKDLPINPVGDTPGFSIAAKNTIDLVSKYQKASVFLNTSQISPIPMSVLEAMSCGCPIVSTATCEIPKILEDGVNAFISNDEDYLRDRLIWYLKNKQEAAKIGKAARETILRRFNLKQYCEAWQNIFDGLYGKALVR